MQPGLRVHRSRGWNEADVTARAGVPVTAPARTLLDLATRLPPRALRRAVRRAQSLELTGVRQITDLVGRSRGRRGWESHRDGGRRTGADAEASWRTSSST